MNRDIQLHDSTLSTIIQCEGSVTIFLSDAEIHESPGLPACDLGLLWTQDALIVIHRAEPFTFEAPLPIWITDGFISSGQVFHDGFIPATGRFEGPTELILTLSTEDGSDGGTLTLKGTGVTIKLTGEPSDIVEFNETARCSPPEVET